MEIKGKIIAALEPRTGVSQRTGNAWKTQEFVIETEGQYPKRCVFEVFGEDKLKEMAIAVGEYGIVSFDIDAHEFSRKDGTTAWVNSAKAWRFIHTDYNFNPIGSAQTLPLGTTAAPAAPAPAAATVPTASPAGITAGTQPAYPPLSETGMPF